MNEQIPSPAPSVSKRVGRAFLNATLAVVLILVACLIGVGGAAIFIYRQMGNPLSVARTPPAKNVRVLAEDTEANARPRLVPVQPETAAENHGNAPTVADSSEWHFAEFSDQPRYIDVTYDGGRQHARLRVNTVLSSKPEASAPSALVADDATTDDDNSTLSNLSTGSRYIIDKETGRVVGIDGTAGAALEVRRALPVTPAAISATTTIRNPVPEVRVASPVMQYGRPIFDDDRPVQAAIPVDNRFLPTRKALPVNADDPPETASDAPEAADNTALAANGDEATIARPVRRSKPSLQALTPSQYDQIFDHPARTSVFRRDRPAD